MCTYHLGQNVKTKFKITRDVHTIYLKASKAYRVSEFDEHMAQLLEVNPNAVNYLAEVGFHKWARAHFANKRYNVMTTNAMESMNVAMKEARLLLVATLVEYVRKLLQQWFYDR